MDPPLYGTTTNTNDPPPAYTYYVKSFNAKREQEGTINASKLICLSILNTVVVKTVVFVIYAALGFLI